MHTLDVIKLRFVTPVHFGRGLEELDKSELMYHSDSMKSAIYSVGINIFSKWKDELYYFDNFKISSCFPYAHNEFFLPKPQINKRIKFNFADEDSSAKKAKKINYISKTVFESFINDEVDTLEAHEKNITADNRFLCDSDETCSTLLNNGKKIKCSFYKEEIQQRVVVPSEGFKEDSKPFYIDRIYFEDNCGLYFLASFKNDELKNEVLQALRVLGENGIGTDRTVGNGIFEFDPDADIISDFNFNLSSNSGFQMPLGLYIPSQDEMGMIDLDQSAWSLIKRGGYMAGSQLHELAHLRKKNITMFGEGSAFKTNTDLEGKVVDLRPDWNEPLHPVWRCGKPIFLKF